MRVFFHVAAMNDGWYKIYREIYDEIVRSGLLNESSKLVVGFLGKVGDFYRVAEELQGDKYELHYFGTNMDQYEFPTLDLLEQFCKTTEELVLYVHTKGCSAPDHAGKRYWRKAMIKSVITDWRTCLHHLRTQTLVGYNLHRPRKKSDGPMHFSGNWWWAKPSYIRTCVPILTLKVKPRVINHWMSDIRFQCEFWLRTGPWMKAQWKSTGSENAVREYYFDPLITLDSPDTDPFEYAGLKVDKRFLVNMNGQDDRLTSALKEIRAAGIKNVERFEAIIPKDLGECKLKTKGQLGCYLSNVECIKRAYESEANALLILEDDVEFAYGIQELFRDSYRVVPSDWDVLFVGSYEKNHGPYVNVKERIWKTGDHWGTHCYLLSKSGIQKMHEYLTTHPIEWEIDMLMVHHMPELKKYSINPSLAYQKPFKSNTRPPKSSSDASQSNSN